VAARCHLKGQNKVEQLCAAKFDGIEPTLIENKPVEAFSRIKDSRLYDSRMAVEAAAANGCNALP
jgi:hypothetical protein